MRTMLIRTMLGLGLIGALAAGCGDDDDDVVMPDTGIVDAGSPDTRVADAALDAAPDAATATHSTSIVVTELTAITGATTSVDISSASVGVNSLTGIPAAAVKTGNPLASPIGQCIGLAFKIDGANSVVPTNPNAGNAGNITITGHQYMGAGCTVNPAGLFCAPMTVTCARSGTGTASSPYTYDCDTPNNRAAANDQRSLPVESFFAETAPGMLTVNVAGGPAMAAFSRTVPVAESARFTTPTLVALSTRSWSATTPLTLAVDNTATSGAMINRLEITNGDPRPSNKTGSGDAFTKVNNDVTLTDATGAFVAADIGRTITIAGATTSANNGPYVITAQTATTVTYVNAAGVAEAYTGSYSVAGAGPGMADSPTCTLADKQFPSLGKCGATRYAVLTCVDVFVNTKDIAGTAINATFAEALAANASLVRVTSIKTGNPASVTVPGTPNTALVAAGQGHVFTDTTVVNP